MEEYIIIFISDTHSKHKQVTDIGDGNIIICSGDISSMGYYTELKNFCMWFSSLDFDYHVFIAGNHDFCFQDSPGESLEFVNNWGIDYLQDDFLIIGDYNDSVKIWGTPWQPEFNNWAFNLPRNGQELKEKWDLIPLDTDILITHGPPFGHLDKLFSGSNIGCELLRERIDIVKPKIHIFGHIHSSYGYKYDSENNIHFINASVLNEQYNFQNKPIRVKWNKNTNSITFL